MIAARTDIYTTVFVQDRAKDSTEHTGAERHLLEMQERRDAEAHGDGGGGVCADALGYLEPNCDEYCDKASTRAPVALGRRPCLLNHRRPIMSM